MSLADRAQANGVVGAGGGGFPTHVKLRAKAETIILNAAECEPLLHKDKELLGAFPHQISDGLEQARQCVGASSAVIGIKHKYTALIKKLTPLLPAGMRIKPLSDSYPAGDEFILVYDVTGRIIAPGNIPLSVGCVVINVETALNIALDAPVIRKYLTVAGAVKSPVTIGVAVGTSFAECIELAGGADTPDPVVLVGGAMMGRFCDDLTQPVTKTTGGLIVLPPDHPLVIRYTKPLAAIRRIGASACDQCTFCTYFCPRWLLGHPIEPHKAMRSLGFNETGQSNVIGTLFCCECNLCTMMACPEDLDPKTICSTNKSSLMKQKTTWATEADPDRAALHLDDRRVPVPRLIRKMGLSGFVNTGPLLETDYRSGRVVLPLKQHAGAPAEARVAVGQRVRTGDEVARPPGEALGAVIHASIDGKIASIDGAITIEADLGG